MWVERAAHLDLVAQANSVVVEVDMDIMGNLPAETEEAVPEEIPQIPPVCWLLEMEVEQEILAEGLSFCMLTVMCPLKEPLIAVEVMGEAVFWETISQVVVEAVPVAERFMLSIMEHSPILAT